MAGKTALELENKYIYNLIDMALFVSCSWIFLE